MDKSNILFMSRYSPKCKELLNLMQKTETDFSDLEIIYLDNELTRNRLLNNDKLNISHVPTLIVNDGGVLMKIDPDNVFKWFEKFLKTTDIIVDNSPIPLTDNATANALANEKPSARTIAKTTLEDKIKLMEKERENGLFPIRR
jgi:glutaredoxin-related protein